ncbi:transcription factor bHLH30-like [Primulina huaijiensis]|uniref:transcription factor bHLH30-like n=1 Tax=Primulina huaijiensis TaxID=1492673 RepID=UPI003CC744C7
MTRRRKTIIKNILISQGIYVVSNNGEGFQVQDLSLVQEMQQENTTDAYIGVGGSTLCISPVHIFNPVDNFQGSGSDPFHLQPPPSFGSYFNGRGSASLQFRYDGHDVLDRHMRLISEALVQMVHPNSAPFGLQAELQKMTTQEIMDAKALAASKSHSEAERRRRERINNHLAKLRSLLPSTIKTDKASLLADVVQQVKELKRQTSVIQGTSPVPSETDEIKVDNASDEDGKLVIKASICCEDRSDLLPDLIKTLKSLRLRTLTAEMTTLGGRVKNVLYITCEADNQDSNIDNIGFEQQQPLCISSIQEALQAVMKCNGNECGTSGSVKRQRTNSNILKHRSL